MLRFHAQTGGSTLTAQQPLNNVVRVSVQVLAAALGGAQSIHANGFDEALALPTETSARLALRTQQVIAAESGIRDTVDPLGGSYALERLTAELEERARAEIAEIDRRGGAVQCIEYMRDAIADAAFRHHEEVLAGTRPVVGVNVLEEDDEQPVPIHRVDPQIEIDQVERIARLRAARDAASVEARLADVRAAARGTDNLLPPMREALRARATVGEVCGVLRAEFGEYDRVRAYRG
jgi:methylmalonyl-CoA mutase N-terminal domain/subunit